MPIMRRRVGAVDDAPDRSGVGGGMPTLPQPPDRGGPDGPTFDPSPNQGVGDQVPAPKLPGFAPGAQPPPYGGEGNPEFPRPSSGGGIPPRINLPNATPRRPMAPTPVAAAPAQPFTPMAPPRGVLGSAMSPSSGLLGKAGGLLGGGLGVPGIRSGPQDVSALIQAILQRLGR